MRVKRYRIVKDTYAGFEVQVWRWWFPFWIQCHSSVGCANTHCSIEQAKKFIEIHKEPKVVFIEP